MEVPPADRGDGSGSSPASVLVVLEGMRALGIDVDAVCAAARLSFSELETRQVTISTPQVAALWREGTRLYGRDTIGLAVAMAAPTGRIVVDYVASTAATVRDALVQVSRYHRLITQNGDLRLRTDGDRILFELLPNVPLAAIPPAILELSMATTARRVHDWSGRRVRGVQFPHAALGPRTEYDRFLGVPVRFEVEHAALVLDEDLLASPVRGHDPHLFRIVRAHAEQLLASQPHDTTMRAQVRRVLLGQIAQGEPDIAAVARTLAVSERSLQRRLHEEDTSFREVVDDSRKDLALGYLGDHRLTVSEVAYLLGYSESAAFVRAFKRWTGTTPGTMRDAAS